ncbi:MAG TPA: cytochrome c [Pyrinomonadaceae bacterium]|nr:cytochrome c [Pyrinomonadaceae bacterium]
MWNTDFETGRRGDKETGGEEARPVSLSPCLPVFACLLLSAFCLLLSGCRIDMQDQPRYEAYEAGDKKYFADGTSARAPVEGTVPRQKGGQYRDREDYFLTGKGGAGQTPAQTASMFMPGGSSSVSNAAGGVPGAAQGAATGGPDIFPIELNETALKRGQERYNIYCGICHGALGEGDGMIVRRGYRKPPSYFEDRLQENITPAAHFFDVITNGWGAMPSYAEQIPAEDRWKIIAYVRALQLSRRLKMEDLTADERGKVTSGAQKSEGQGGAHDAGGEKH